MISKNLRRRRIANLRSALQAHGAKDLTAPATDELEFPGRPPSGAAGWLLALYRRRLRNRS